MTNADIIINEAIGNGIYTEEQVMNFFKTIGGLPLHTFAEWKRRGFAVKKGEKASLTCWIWRHKKTKGVLPMEDGNDVEVDEEKFYKTKAFFFKREQVERIVEAVGA
jgi:hypothetical protein